MRTLLLLAACLVPAGANDPARLDDQGICWNPAPFPGVTSYEVTNQWGAAVIVAPWQTCLPVGETSLLTVPAEHAQDADLEIALRVQAFGAEGPLGGPSGVACFQPWLELRSVNCRWEETPRGRRWRCDACEVVPLGYPRRAPWAPACVG